MNLIESAKFNKGEKKLYRGIAGNLVAFACRTAFEKGYEGVVAFVAISIITDWRLGLSPSPGTGCSSTQRNPFLWSNNTLKISAMVENKKIDEEDLVFINQQWTEEEKKSFSDFLKTRKKRKLSQNNERNSTPNKTFTADGLDRKVS